MGTDRNSGGHGLTFWGALQVLFIALKLTGHIDWPWWLVFWPILADVVIVVAVLLWFAVVAAIDNRRKW